MEHSTKYLELMNQIQNLVSNPKDYRRIMINLFDESINDDDTIYVSITDEQIQLIENYNIHVDEYIIVTRSSDNKKSFIKQSALSLCAIIIELIGLIQGYLPNQQLQEQTELLQQEVVELQKQNETLTEIADNLRKAISSNEGTTSAN